MSNFVFFSHPIVLTALNLLYLKAEYYPPNFFFRWYPLLSSRTSALSNNIVLVH